MVIDIPENLARALKQKAEAAGVTTATYVGKLVERDLDTSAERGLSNQPFRTDRGVLAKYGPAPSEEDIAQNRAEMFQNLGQDF